ncbi:hypothetical protein B484DRAFT_395063 [Ochromonadaceae sp. CCMP2298]|nr:hypothetical protein B484DRAFT_395063 [Ochromonadaceae sp. CCMP2298]
MEPRGIILNQYNNSPALYVADAYSTDSYLGIWGDCDSKGNRHFIKAALSTKLNAGIDHLYGMTFDAEQNVYTSSQHTDVVQRFYKDTFEPMPFPPYLEETYKSKAMTTFPGTFMQFELPTVHKSSKQGVRDLAHVHGEIWIANEDIDGVTLVDTFTGKVLDLIPVQNPIGLHYEPELGLVFVSCKVKHKQGHVLAISQKTHEVVRTYHSKKMQHPTGMVVYQGTLFVTNQKLREIVAFNVHTGKFKGVIVKKLPGAAEQLTLSPC